MKPWHEDDVFWQTMTPILFHSGKMKAAPAEVDGVIRLLRLKPPAKILDLGCGIGRHAIAFAKRGFEVTGLDRTAHYLHLAHEHSEKANIILRLVQEDMRRFCEPENFNAVVSLYTSFGYFKDEKENLKVLQNIFESLKQGGNLLIDTLGRKVLLKTFTEKTEHPLQDGMLIESKKLNKERSWLETTWTFKAGELEKSFTFAQHLYSDKDLVAIIKQTGFGRIKIYGDFSGSPYDDNAARLIAVAKK